MKSNKLVKDISANTIQTGITQLAGLVIFYILSRFIPKEQFGEFQWTTAVGSTIIAIGSLGLDMVLIKRIAAGNMPRLMAGIHFFHTVLVGIIILTVLLLLQFLLPDLLQYHPLFLLILLQLTLTNLANSFKFSLTGLESFKSLAILAVIFNISKIALISILIICDLLSIKNCVLGFVFTAIIEVLISYIFLSKRLDGFLRPAFRPSSYKNFVRESLPQLGVVLFDSALARIDWILLGIYSTSAITAEYTFAYKFFELSKLPLLILAPVLLTRFSNLFGKETRPDTNQQTSILQFFKLELFISFIIPMIMIFIWTDIIDLITDNKFGAVNQTNFTILAFCIPLHFAINFFWTIAFVQGKLKAIMYITICSSIINLIANMILIPVLGSKGAAIAFLLSSLIQFIFYFSSIDRSHLKITIAPLFHLILVAVLVVLPIKLFIPNPYLAAITALPLYIFICYITKLFSIDQVKKLFR